MPHTRVTCLSSPHPVPQHRSSVLRAPSLRAIRVLTLPLGLSRLPVYLLTGIFLEDLKLFSHDRQ